MIEAASHAIWEVAEARAPWQRMCHGSAMGAPGGASGLGSGSGVRGRTRGVRVLLVALLAGWVACATPRPAPLPPEALEPYLARVAAVRETPAPPEIEARVLAPEAVRARIEQEMARVISPEQRAATTALLRTLDLISADADPWNDLLDLQVPTVAGFYAAIDQRLYVVAREGGPPAEALSNPLVADVLVHELAHAFQDAGSRLAALGLALDGFDDVAFALAAVLEGDALWTEHRDAARVRGEPLPDADAFARRFEAEIEAVLPEGSPWVRATFLRPYPLGYRWVRRVWEAQGQAGLGHMLADPPLTSAALLHPERARAGRDEIALGSEPFAPDPACRSRATSSFGEIGLEAWFAAVAEPPSEVSTWRADRAWLLDCPDGEVWGWLLVFARPEAARALEPALRERAEGLPGGAGVERSGARLLLQRGLAPAGRRWLLERAPVRSYPDLTAWLAAHPEVERNAARLRQSRGAP